MIDTLIYWVWLCNLSGISSNKVTALLGYFDTIEEVYRANFEEYRNVPGLSRLDGMVLLNKDLTHAQDIILKTEKMGARILTYDDINYPDALRLIDTPPYILYVKGEIMKWDRLFPIAVVGTRRSSDYGVKAADNISYGLAQRGITIVSGMARGIDSVAARAALRAGNKTVAVLGCGLDIVYPKENEKLMEEIAGHGAVITEYPPGTPPKGLHFPERNRIISGLSKGVLVVEAPAKSGALITASHALEHGRDVFSVPGSIFDANSKGSNMLIKQGAKMTVCAEDILEEYPLDVEKLNPPELPEDEKQVNNVRQFSLTDDKYKNLEENEKMIIGFLIEKNMNVEEIMLRTGLGIAEINSVMPLLEMYGFVRKLPGDNYKLEV